MCNNLVVRAINSIYLQTSNISGESTVRQEQPQRQISDGAATRVDANMGQESWLMPILCFVFSVNVVKN